MNYTINDIVKKGEELLRRKGIDRARFESTIITNRILGKSILDILINPKFKVSLKKRNKIYKKIFKRANGQPISKIFGIREFYSNEFFVNSKVLDPRPESELLIEVLKKEILNKKKKLNVLELGVGSGCLIISLFLELKNYALRGIGIDISEEAIKVAKKNVRKYNLENILSIEKSFWFSNINEKFDIILTNPPYIKSSEIKNLDLDVKNYDPIISLDGGLNGLQSYEEIAREAKNFLKYDGIICMEHGFSQRNSVNEIFNDYGFISILEEKDLQGINRVVGYKLNKF